MQVNTADRQDYAERVERVRVLCDEGKFVQAHAAAAPLGPLQSWQGVAERIVAARLATHLGAGRLGDALFLRTWRANRADPAAVFHGAMAIQSTRGALAALDLLNASGIIEADSAQRWDATAYAAYLYAIFRDFGTAETLIARALEHADEAWIWAQRAAIYEMEDRYEDALAAARRGLALKPNSRSALQYTARFLSLFEKDAEAIALLRDALGFVESAHIAAQLAALELEQGQLREALASLERYEQFALLRDKWASSWLAGRRCDIYSHLGDNARALEQAKLADSGFYREVAAHLERAGPEARRVLLPVGFVRQHHMTCAPATLSALSRFWSRPADHLELAEEICYDGTSNQSERRWGDEHGWRVREFTATAEASHALIDAGIPFTLSTVHPGSAHLQAAIGYDSARGVLFIRDPYDRVYTEFAEGPFFEGYASSGPRGMAMVPREEAARLDAIALPDGELYDLAYEVQGALQAHERPRAAAALQTLTGRAPDHRITLGATRSLASYDGDRPGMLAAVERLLAQYPQDVNLRISKADLLRQLADHGSYLAFLEGEVNGAAPHTLLELALAQALLEDGRTRAEAVRRLRKLARRWNKAETLSSLADAHWYAGEYPRAVYLYRLASSLEEFSESHAGAYFRAARMVREEARALDYLRDRVRRLGKLSPWPHITLFNCLEEIERTAEALEGLERALAQHPEDGDLLLFAAKTHARTGGRARAQELLARARGHSKPIAWLRTAAQLHEMEGDLAESLRLALEVVEQEPLDLGVQRAAARLLAETRERAAAVAHLRALVARFPHHQGANELLVEWLNEEAPAVKEEALRQLIAISPANAWANRELAWVLGKQRRFDEAREQAGVARALAPTAAAQYTVEGMIELRAGRLPEAREALREALRLDVDSDMALTRLIEACASLEERREALAFVLEEMKRQVVSGDSLLNFQRMAHDTLEAEALARELDEARAIRPDLWQAWVACVRQRAQMQQYEAAHALCREAAGKFPLLPRIHLELADTARHLDDRETEFAALHEALRLSPGWSLVARRLCDALEAEGDFAGSRAQAEAALRHNPADAVLHGYISYPLWQLGEREEAIAHLQEAVRHDTGYTWAWRMLKERSAELGRPEAALALAREIAEQRAGEFNSWMALANIADDADEALGALDRAITLLPLDVDAHKMKVDLLIRQRRYDDALAALRATAWGEQPPVALRVKEASVLAARGERPAAIRRLQEVLADDPNYYPGWEMLADLQDEAEEYAGYLAAAREMVRIAPDEAFAAGFLADAIVKAKDKEDVRPWLRRALHLKPDYAFAGYMLFDQEMKADDLDAAERALGVLAPHVPGGWTLVRRIRLTARRREKAAALAQFGELLKSDVDDTDMLRMGLQRLEEEDMGDAALRVLEKAVREADVNPRAGTLWVECRSRAPIGLMRFRGLGRMLESGEVGQYAAQEVLRHYTKGRKRRALLMLLWRHGKALARDDMTYGLVSYALLTLDMPRRLVQRCADWQERKGVPAWALLNLTCALRDLGRGEAAHAVSLEAVTRKPDHSRPKHEIWLALDAAHARNYAEARRLLDATDESDIGDYYRFLVHTVRAILAACDPANMLHKDAFRNAREEIRRAQRAMPRYISQPALRRALWRAMWQISRARDRRPPLASVLWIYLAVAY